MKQAFSWGNYAAAECCQLPILQSLGSLVQYAQHLYLVIYQSIGSDKRKSAKHQLTNIRYERRSARAGKSFQLVERLQNNRNNVEGRVNSKDSLVILVDSIQVTFSFFSQYYARHVLPT